MATKAKSTTSSKSAKKPSTTTVKPTRVATAKTTPKPTVTTAVRPVTRQKTYQLSNDLSGAQVLGEMLGTFMLVAVVAATGGNAFLIGLALVAIVAATFSISGAHVNPAITFGLFVMRKVSLTKMLFYWMAQFVGAIAAILVTNQFAQTPVNLSLSSFGQWDWRVVFAEVIGMTIFMFTVAAAAQRAQTDNDKAFGIGLGLFLALIISGSLMQQAITKASADAAQSEAKDAPRITKLSGTTLNPAVALSVSEANTQNAMMGGEAQATGVSRLTLETIFGTLFGAAIGGRLYMLLARNSEEGKL